MKKYFTGMAAIAIGAVTATAAIADGMPRGPAPAAMPTCGTSTMNWNGGYAGVQIGSASARSTLNDEGGVGISSITGVGIAGTREDEAFTIGGVIGYDWQKCNTVFGIEADLAWLGVERSWGSNQPLVNNFFGAGSTFSGRTEMDFYGAFKLRSGLAFDNLLLYITGGVAFANIEHRASVNAPGVAPLATLSSSETRWGWVTGFGTEFALTPKITWRSEVTYTRFEDKNVSLNDRLGLFNGVANSALRLNAQDDLWLVRTGINFKF